MVLIRKIQFGEDIRKGESEKENMLRTIIMNRKL